MEQELENESSAIVEVSKAQVEALGERLARKLLDVSWEEALRKYSTGELQGSLAEIEISWGMATIRDKMGHRLHDSFTMATLRLSEIGSRRTSSHRVDFANTPGRNPAPATVSREPDPDPGDLPGDGVRARRSHQRRDQRFEGPQVVDELAAWPPREPVEGLRPEAGHGGQVQ